MNVAKLRYLPGLALAALAGLLYSRAGHGPFGDPAQRSRPCEATRCAHNASAILVAAVAALLAARPDGRAEAAAA
jgi:hypothetical protein